MSENIVWRVPDCAYCEKPIDGEEAESGRFVQHFGNEGDYYFHRACYEEWQRESAEDPHWPEYQV